MNERLTDDTFNDVTNAKYSQIDEQSDAIKNNLA